MSGDVQPRKRKDKKKKKEDAVEEVIFQQHQHAHQATIIPTIPDDSNIHIQKEVSTGGGVCAKLVFFVLLTILTTLIGLIITEHRGLTDLDTIDTESRFAQIFEGWIDNAAVDHGVSEELSIEHSEEETHDDEEEVEGTEEDEEEEEEEEQEYEQDQSLDQEDEEEDEEEASEEKATDEVETIEETEESDVKDEDTVENESERYESEHEDEEELDEEQDDEDDEVSEEEEEEKYEASEREVDETSIPTKEDVTLEEDDDDDEHDEEEEEEEEEEEKGDKSEVVKILDRIKTEKRRYVVDSQETVEQAESDETADLTESEEAAEEEIEESPSLDATQESVVDESEDDALEEEGDDDEEEPSESKETIKKVHSKKVPVPKIKKKKQVLPEGEPHESETYNKKIDKKKEEVNKEEIEELPPDLSRRNTIVTPPSLQEIEHDIENVEEEYSEDEEDYDSQYDGKPKQVSAKTRYQELQSTYSNTLTPDWEPKEIRERRRDYEEDEEDEAEEGEEDYDDEISENEDEELLHRLEAKYGKIHHSDEEQDDDVDDDVEDDNDEEDDLDDEEELEEDDFGSWKRVRVPSEDVPEDTDSENEKHWPKERSGAQAVYEFENITNTDDWNIQAELDQAQQNLANDAAYALTLFNKILEKNPNSSRALYGKAQSLDSLAEQKRSNNLLQQAIATYQQTLKVREVPDALFQMAAERCIDRMRFRGLYAQSVTIHKLLIDKFPKEVRFRNHLAVTYLTMNKIPEARKILQEIFLKWPKNGFALVHYGFILKTNNNDLVQAVDYMKRGIATKEPGVIDGRFYFHLGDALTRLGRNEEAMSVYEDGVKHKVFLSKYQRSLYNVDRLTGKPWWKKEETSYVQFFKNLEGNWTSIRKEGLSILNKKGNFQPEAENLRDVGDWKQFELYARGIKHTRNCQQCPFTCKLVETLPDAIGCRRGQIKFSVMHPGTHVWPHCGPTNCRLRAHLGLKVPSNTYIRVGEEIRSWEEGKFIIFDDSFEHEVWHNGTTTRLVLIIDVWHPELTRQERQTLSSI